PALNSHTMSLPRTSPKERRRKEGKSRGKKEWKGEEGCGCRAPLQFQDSTAISQQPE
ncbi:unnamed protein product, partial [Rangifer tarandus platyrhynchus]